jgi:hypothetical protein
VLLLHGLRGLALAVGLIKMPKKKKKTNYNTAALGISNLIGFGGKETKNQKKGNNNLISYRRK